MKTIELISLLFIVCIYTFVSGCRKDEDNPVQPPLTKPDTLSLSVTDQTNTSITLKVELKGSSGIWRFSLTRLLNGMEEKTDTFTVFGRDTLIYDNNKDAGLLPDTSYTYRVKVAETGDTASVITRTLGYTSHDFEWTEYSFGIGGYYFSRFFDVWGTSSNNVYACGAVYTMRNDEVVIRGIWHWDGVEWTPEESVEYGANYEITGFSENDIWSAGAKVYHYNGNIWEEIDSKSVGGKRVILDSVLYSGGAKTCVWGTGSNNLYFGTEGGTLLYWNGKKTSRIPLPTHAPVTSIYGLKSDNIYLTTGKWVLPKVGELFHYDGKSWSLIAKSADSPVRPDDLEAPFNSVWYYDKDNFCLGGDYLYKKTRDGWRRVKSSVIPIGVYGTKPNDVFICGPFGRISHFNGKDWKDYQMSPGADLYNIYMVGNDVFISGADGMTAYICHGKRK